MKNLTLKKPKFLENPRELIGIIAVNLVMLLVFLELGSLGWYFIRYKELFYTRSKNAEAEKAGINLAGIRLNNSIVERLHPYFGYVQTPGPDFRPGFKYNQAGFISPYEYPFVRTNPNQLIVGVFGGSVASNYSIFEIQNKVLENKLRQIPGLENKEIVILSFAVGGYKQPQQLLALNYFLAAGQEFDMIINIDGFNEVAFANENNESNINIMMPSSQHVVPLTNIANNSLSPKATQTMMRINEHKTNLKNALELLPKCRLAYCYALTSLYAQNTAKNYREDVKSFESQRIKSAKNKDNQGSIVYFYPQKEELTSAQLYEAAANNWMKTSLLMKQIANSNNIPYFHVLQPNQYYPTKRVFSEAEKKVAFSEDSPYKDAVKLGYPALFQKAKELQKNGVNLLIGVEVLDTLPEKAYIDTCCHYTPVGEMAFSNYIADSIINIFKQGNSPNNSAQ